jgi:hypothetical protein
MNSGRDMFVVSTKARPLRRPRPSSCGLPLRTDSKKIVFGKVFAAGNCLTALAMRQLRSNTRQ